MILIPVASEMWPSMWNSVFAPIIEWIWLIINIFFQTGLSGNVIIISVLYYGGILVSTQNITVGNLTSFLLYAAYIGVSIGGLSSFYSELNKGIGAAGRLWDIMDRVPQVPTYGIEFSFFIFYWKILRYIILTGVI